MISARLKTNWVNALRQGAYQQHIGNFSNGPGDAVCALAVLVIEAFKLRATPPPPVYGVDWGREAQELLGPYLSGMVMRLNDGARLPFETIADFVENCVPTRSENVNDWLHKHGLISNFPYLPMVGADGFVHLQLKGNLDAKMDPAHFKFAKQYEAYMGEMAKIAVSKLDETEFFQNPPKAVEWRAAAA